MKILITGSTGMVGRNVIDVLSQDNYHILAPTSIELDLTKYTTTLNYFKKHHPDFIIHTAGHVGGIHANISQPIEFLITNLDIGRNVILSARQVGVKKIINLGSSCMYPRNAPNPLKEEMILQGELEPTNEGYALAKIMVAKLCDYINKESSDYKYKTMIPCNIYGRYDKFDTKRSHLIPAIINKLHQANINNEQTVEIWGDGNARREFMYARDLADAIYYAIKHFDEMPFLLNIGEGSDHTINEYYSTIAEIIEYKGNFVHNCERPVGVLQKLVSINRQKSWGWQPTTELVDGIKQTYEYYLQELKH